MTHTQSRVREEARELLAAINSIDSDQRFTAQGRHDKKVDLIESALSRPGIPAGAREVVAEAKRYIERGVGTIDSGQITDFVYRVAALDDGEAG